MIDDGINGDGSLTCLTVTDDKLSLTSSDGNHRVDSFDTCLERSIYGLSCDDTGCHSLNLTIFIGFNRTLAVYWLTKSIYYTACHGVADRNLNYSARSLYGITFVDVAAASEEYRTDIVFLKVEDHAVYLAGELEELALHGILKSVHTRDTIGNLDNSTYI